MKCHHATISIISRPPVPLVMVQLPSGISITTVQDPESILACLAFEGTPALHGSRHPLRQHSPLKSNRWPTLTLLRPDMIDISLLIR